jgi:hypothetical protein
VQVFPAPVRAARLASGGQCRESNHGGSVPSMESAAETLRQRSGIDGLTRRRQHLRTARSSLRIEVLQACRRYVGSIVTSPIDETSTRTRADGAGPAPWRQPGCDARHPHDPGPHFVKPTNAAGQGRLDLTLRLRAWLS